MLPRRIASRYAEALFDLAQQQGKTQDWGQQLEALATVFAGTPELRTVLAHPEVTLARKGEILRQAFSARVAPEILAMLEMLIERQHELDLATIHDVFTDLWNVSRQVVPVMVTAAAPLSDAQRQALASTLAARLGARVELQVQIDPELIAGMTVRMGDRVIDASAKSLLEDLREAMLTA